MFEQTRYPFQKDEINMNHNIVKFLVVWVWLLSFWELPAQLIATDPDDYTADSLRVPIQLIAKNTGDKILLRWAPGSPGAWHLSNQSGYRLERLIFRDSNELTTAQWELLATPKPWPLDDWAPIANEQAQDPYAAIAAQAIYGKRNFSDPENTTASFLEKATELENLYAAALLAAEFSRNAAIASGLRYEDEDLRAGYTYIYRVYSLASRPDYIIDTAYYVIHTDEVHPNPVPQIDSVEEGENRIKLYWTRQWERYYSGWLIERSSDQRHWESLTGEVPFIDSPVDRDGLPNEWFTYIDSLDQNYRPYYYRLIGITPFAELSQASAVVRAMGRDRTPPPAPYGIETRQIAPSKMEIRWQFPDTVGDLAGFLITRTEQREGGTEVGLTPRLLPPHMRRFVDTSFDPLVSNWYFVYAVDTAGNAMVGLPEYGSIVDSIPPAPPTQITGQIDTNGVVTLHWPLGPEPDLYGYKVFYANAREHIFTPRTNRILRDTFWSDTIPLNVLTEEIFYAVVAFDLYGNASDWSDIVRLQKPDLVPPTSPLFDTYHISENGVELRWIRSSSHDVVKHLLYRRPEAQPDEWQLLFVDTDTVGNYGSWRDTTVAPRTAYVYRIVAVDDAANYSEKEETLHLRIPDFRTMPAVSRFLAQLDTTTQTVALSWRFRSPAWLAHPPVFAVFRAVDDSGFYFYRMTEAGITRFIDREIASGHRYQYFVKAVDEENELEGPPSEIRVVIFPKSRDKD